MKFLLYAIATLALSGCLFAPSAQEELISPPVTIAGRPIINPELVSIEGSGERFEVVGREGSLRGPDRCIDAYVLTRSEFDQFRAGKVLPNRVSRVSVPTESSSWRVPFQKFSDSAAVVLVPASCETDRYSALQLEAAVFMEIEEGAPAMLFTGTFVLNVARRGNSHAGRYLIQARDATGKAITRYSCHLSTERTSCLPLIWSGAQAPVTVSFTPVDETLSVSDCDFANPSEYYRELRGCRAVTSSSTNDVFLTMWPLENRIDLKLGRASGVSAAGQYVAQGEDQNFLSCHLSTGRTLCKNAIRIPAVPPYTTVLSHEDGLPMHTCLLRRGEGRATLHDGKCALEIKSAYFELVVGTYPP